MNQLRILGSYGGFGVYLHDREFHLGNSRDNLNVVRISLKDV